MSHTEPAKNPGEPTGLCGKYVEQQMGSHIMGKDLDQMSKADAREWYSISTLCQFFQIPLATKDEDRMPRNLNLDDPLTMGDAVLVNNIIIRGMSPTVTVLQEPALRPGR